MSKIEFQPPAERRHSPIRERLGYAFAVGSVAMGLYLAGSPETTLPEPANKAALWYANHIAVPAGERIASILGIDFPIVESSDPGEVRYVTPVINR